MRCNHIKKTSNQAGNVKKEITERAEKGRKDSKLLFIPLYVFLALIVSIVLAIVLSGTIKVVFIILTFLLMILAPVISLPITAKARINNANSIARATFIYLEKQNKLDLLDTLTNDHIVMTLPLVFSNGKIIACPSQGVAVPVEEIDRIEGIDSDEESRKNLSDALRFGLFSVATKKASGLFSSRGIKIFTRDNRCFAIDLDKYEFAQLLKKKPDILPENIRMIDIF